jgi:hypothetical protein
VFITFDKQRCNYFLIPSVLSFGKFIVTWQQKNCDPVGVDYTKDFCGKKIAPKSSDF